MQAGLEQSLVCAVNNNLVGLFRATRLVLHLAYATLLAIPYPHLAPSRQQRLLGNWSRELLAILNIRIRLSGHHCPGTANGAMLAANHISWLDIYVLNAIRPSHFIAKVEVRSWPLIGWLCARIGTIFVDRNRRADAVRANRHAEALLRSGACVGVFPEGTTSDGKQVMHFHSALIQAAIDAGVKLHPVALRYLDDTGRICAAAAFTGDTSLMQSIWRILCVRHFDVAVIFAPALAVCGSDRRSAAHAAQQAISNSLLRDMMPSPIQEHPQLPDFHSPLAAKLKLPPAGYAFISASSCCNNNFVSCPNHLTNGAYNAGAKPDDRAQRISQPAD